jgi:hypothetical protein
LVPHAEIVVASSKEDYDIVKHVRAEWSNAILEFIQRNVVAVVDDESHDDDVVVRVDADVHDKGKENVTRRYT